MTNDYIETLQSVMQAAILEAERLQQAAAADHEAMCTWNDKTTALQRQIETEADKAAYEAASAWLKALGEY